MYQFFVEPSQIQGNRIVITGKDVNHIKNVLRMKKGEELGLTPILTLDQLLAETGQPS